MMGLFRKKTMDLISPDAIEAMADGAMPAGMTAAVAELANIHAAQDALNQQICTEREVADGFVVSAFRHISDQERTASRERLAGLNAQAARLEGKRTTTLQNIRAFKPEKAAAVRQVLLPIRKQAAAEVIRACENLLTAAATLNATGAALSDSGIAAAHLPTPFVTGLIEMARSIVAATSPENERR